MPSSSRVTRPWFGIAFLLAGLVPAAMAGLASIHWYQARSWEPSEATILSANLETTQGSGPKRSSSSKVVATFEYQWDGETYQSDRISPFNHVELFSGHKKQLVAKLRNAKRLGESVPCYVDPNTPNRALLLREFRWPSFALLTVVSALFGFAGVALTKQYLAHRAELRS